MYNEHPYIIPYIPPYEPDRGGLSASLLHAIESNDIKCAREIFDIAFWNKINLVPDWHHLLVASIQKDAPMIKLLVTHGAKWTPAETRCLQEIFSQEWPDFLSTLRSGGLRIDQSGYAPTVDQQMLGRMTEYLLQEHKKGALRETVKKKIEKTDFLRDAFNRKNASDRFGRLYGRSLIDPKNFDDLIKASQQKLYAVTPQQFLAIVDSLHRQYRSGVIPDSVITALRLLKESGVDDSLISRYAEQFPCLGKKEPGMAKILYDLGILKPNFLFLEALRRNAGLPNTLKELYWHKRSDKKTEFFFQILLGFKKKQEMPQHSHLTSYHTMFKRIYFPTPPTQSSWFHQRLHW